MFRPSKEFPDAAAPILPRHIAIVMDGNGRWARARGKSRNAGHRAGVRAAHDVVETCGKLGVDHLTLFAFSSENWRRPEQEVRLLMRLFVEALAREVAELHRNNVRLDFIGDIAALSKGLQAEISRSEALTANNDGLALHIAVSYGGRWDINQAIQKLAARVAEGSLRPDEITEAVVGAALELGNVPDPDLLIRTGGERRISNFLLWNLAYSEIYFSDLLWPDFTPQALRDALQFFSSRERRFGRTAEQLKVR